MKSSKLSELKMREARFWLKMKFEPIFFQVLWQFFNPKRSLPQGGRKGGLGGIPPAPLQILGEICSNFFERTPLVFYAYIIKSVKNSTYYYGHTSNLEARVKQHNLGKSSYTKNLRPWVLHYYESFESKSKMFAIVTIT